VYVGERREKKSPAHLKAKEPGILDAKFLSKTIRRKHQKDVTKHQHDGKSESKESAIQREGEGITSLPVD